MIKFSILMHTGNRNRCCNTSATPAIKSGQQTLQWHRYLLCDVTFQTIIAKFNGKKLSTVKLICKRTHVCENLNLRVWHYANFVYIKLFKTKTAN